MRKETKIIGCGWMRATMDAISAEATALSAKGKGRSVQITETCNNEHCFLKAQTLAQGGKVIREKVLGMQTYMCDVYQRPSPYVKIKKPN